MKIISEHSGEYKDVINSFYNLERFDSDSESEILFQGYSTSRNNQLKEKYKHYNKRVYLNLEAPCAYCSTETCNIEQQYFTHVYTLCPYTCEWMNKRCNTKFIPIPFPYAKESFQHVNYESDKSFDVIYMGHLLGFEHFKIIDILKKYNYLHISLSDYQYPYTPTHVNINSKFKWELLSKSKVSIAMNLAPITNFHKEFIIKYDEWFENKAFKNLESNYIPQFKPRIIESMVCKTLTLVKYDEWNIIEKWFTPNEHFIYWYNLEDLFYKLHHIINNYKSYKKIIDSAYNKVQEYEIEKIYNKIKNNESF